VEAFIDRFNTIFSYDAQLTLWTGIIAGTFAFMVLERFFHATTPFKGLGPSLKAAPLMILVSPAVAIVPTVLISDALSSRDGPLYPINLDFHQFALWFSDANAGDQQPGLAASIIAILCYLLLSDFFYYWFHRLQHTRLLWSQHRLHHSDKHLNVLTTHRHHWLEEPLRVMIMILPMSLIFEIRTVHLVVLTIIITQWVYLLHANLRLSFGPLTSIIAGPQYHRIHHSIEAGHRNKNFATYFPVWDILFGTYYRPAPGEFPATGVQGTVSEASWREIIWPFTFSRREPSSSINTAQRLDAEQD
jgi:sterol desaturase/sphingolipid hydroxylase (fatty acid hydroxylase superfamily)